MADVEVEGKTFTPQEISAMILQKIKSDAEAYLGEKVEKQLLLFRRTLMTRNVKLPNRREKSPAWKWFA